MNFTEIFSAYPELIQGAKTTALIFVIAVAFGIAFGSLLALARNSQNKLIQFPAMVYINAFRSIPLIMVLLGFYLAIPTFLKSLGFTDVALPSAIISFCLFESAYFAEVIRSGINGVSANQTAAAKSLGLSKWQTSSCVFRTNVTGRFGIVTGDFGNVTGHLGNVTERTGRQDWRCV